MKKEKKSVRFDATEEKKEPAKVDDNKEDKKLKKIKDLIKEEDDSGIIPNLVLFIFSRMLSCTEWSALPVLLKYYTSHNRMRRLCMTLLIN